MNMSWNYPIPTRIIDSCRCEVDCDQTPVLPTGLGLKEMMRPRKHGLVLLERLGNDLFINGRKLDWFFVRRRYPGDSLLDGYGPHTGIDSDFNLHTNIGLALFQHRLIPRRYLKDERDRWREIWFKGVMFRDSAGQIFWFTLRAEGIYWLPGIRPAWIETLSHGWEPIAA